MGEESQLSAKRLAVADLAIGAILFAASLAYAWAWPRDLNSNDEGLFLYESHRILAGDVPYRDFFEFVTPGAWYLLALLFRVFGTEMATARGMMAVVHALIVLATFAACRRLGVRRELSATAAVFHMAGGYPSFAVATPHWISTLLSLIGFHCALGYMGSPSPRRAFALGVLGGVAIVFQQHKGVYLLLALGLLVVLQAAVDEGWRGGRLAARRAVALAGGAALVVVPVTLAILAAAGLAPVYQALVVFPFTGYREFHTRIEWGKHGPLSSYHPYPGVMMVLPIVAPVAVLARAAWQRFVERDRDGAVSAVLLAPFCLYALLCIAYNPGYGHIAMAAPLFAIAVADSVDSTLRKSVPGAAPALGATVCALLLALFARQAYSNLRERRLLYSVRADTGLGATDFLLEQEVKQIEALRELARKEPESEIYLYPSHPAVYLMMGRRNPTRFQFVLANYTTPAQMEEITRDLEAKKVRYVAVMGQAAGAGKTAVWEYIARHYRKIPFGAFDRRRSFLFERIEPGKTAPASTQPSEREIVRPLARRLE